MGWGMSKGRGRKERSEKQALKVRCDEQGYE